ncbi:MAG TPA: hypothetical protein VIY49_16930 [Bryobacteraceae bacterium]
MKIQGDEREIDGLSQNSIDKDIGRLAIGRNGDQHGLGRTEHVLCPAMNLGAAELPLIVKVQPQREPFLKQRKIVGRAIEHRENAHLRGSFGLQPNLHGAGIGFRWARP